MTTLTPLEDQVIRMLLAKDDEVLAVLRLQVDHAKVSSRRMTGVGFYTDIVVAREAARAINRPSFKLGDVNGTAANVKHGLGFLLYVTDGVLSMLEGYTYDEPWPNEVQGLVLAYSEGQGRDLDNVRKMMQKHNLPQKAKYVESDSFFDGVE
jgi:hypothetical protein